AAVVGAVTLGVAACTTADHSPGSSTTAGTAGTAGSAAPSATSPPRRPIQTPPAAQAQPSPRTTVSPGSRPRTGTNEGPAVGAGRFRWGVWRGPSPTAAAGASTSVPSTHPAAPPHDTAQQWNTAVWVTQSTYPSTPGKGTAYVYGHACHYH